MPSISRYAAGHFLEKRGRGPSSASHHPLHLLGAAQPSVPATAAPRTNQRHLTAHLDGTGPPAAIAATASGAGREGCSIGAFACTGDHDRVDIRAPDQVYLSSQAHFQAVSQLAALADSMQKVQGRVSSLMLSSFVWASDSDMGEIVADRQHGSTEGAAASEAVTTAEGEGCSYLQGVKLSSECAKGVLEDVNAALAGIENIRRLLLSDT